MGPINLTDPVETAEQKRSSSSVMQLHAEAQCESEDIPVPSQDLSLAIILMQTVQASHFAALSSFLLGRCSHQGNTEFRSPYEVCCGHFTYVLA